MFIDRLFNSGSTPLLQKTLEFTAARHEILAEDVANVDTPNYKMKDLSLGKFQSMLRQRAEVRESSAPGSVGFDDIQVKPEEDNDGILFHDGNNRSVEQLMTDEAKNALMHNLAVELLRKQFSTMELALKERVS
jgi:flagellar basal-body rod protein FlgB